MIKPIIRVTFCGLCGAIIAHWRTCCYRCQIKMETGWRE